MTTTCEPLVQLTCRGNTISARVCCGSLTEIEAEALDRELATALAGRVRPVVRLDLAPVAFLGSMALGRFVSLSHDVRAAGGSLTLVNLAPHLRQVFEVCRLSGLLDTDPTGPPGEAVKTLAYRMWVEAGRPDGDGKEYWYSAERDLAVDR